MKPFIAFINLLNPLPKKSSDKLLAITRIKDLKKGDTITNTEEKPNDFYILKSGIIRSFYTDKNGKEYIRQIFTSSMATGALGALILNGISRLSYDCLSNCEVYAINFKDFKNLIKTDKELSLLYAATLEISFLRLESKVYDLSILNATERYLKLKKQIPDIENLIPQYHIASYLNITPIQLSRIRKEIYSK